MIFSIYKTVAIILLGAFFLMVSGDDCEAQILNIERHRLHPDTSKPFLIKGTLGLSLYNRSAASDSPVDMLGYNASLNAVYFTDRHTYMVIGQLDYLKINENPFLNFGFIHLRGHFFHDSPSSLEVFNQYSYDNFRGLDPRVLVGAGLRQTLLNTDRSLFTLGTGIMYEWEKWEHPAEDFLVEKNLIKSTNYLSYRLSVNEYIDFNTIAYYQVGYDSDISEFRNRFSGTINFNSSISDYLSITNTFSFSYENRPVVPITRFIYQFKTGLSVSF